MSHEIALEAVSDKLECLNIAVRREAILVFTNLIHECQNTMKLQECLRKDDYRVFTAFNKNLTVNDPNLIKEILEALDKVFGLHQSDCCGHVREFTIKFEELGGIDTLDELQKHPNS